MNYNKAVAFDSEKDCFMVRREDITKLFQMYADCLCKDVESELESDERWAWMISSVIDVRQEHVKTLEKVIDCLGMGKNFLKYFTDYRQNL